jgi:hypothetical protein
MQLSDERLALVRSDIAILHEQLDQAVEQSDCDRQFLRRELLTTQQMYHALIRTAGASCTPQPLEPKHKEAPQGARLVYFPTRRSLGSCSPT